jgi:hypothetical protein
MRDGFIELGLAGSWRREYFGLTGVARKFAELLHRFGIIHDDSLVCIQYNHLSVNQATLLIINNVA